LTHSVDSNFINTSMDKYKTSGFLLTRQWFDRGRLVLRFWVKTDSGAIRIDMDNQYAILFVKSAQIECARRLLAKEISFPRSDSFSKGRWYDKPLPLKNFEHEAMHGIYFKEQRWLYRARESLAIAGITPFEADVNPADRFLMERFITGALSVEGDLLEEQGVKSLINPKLKADVFAPSYSVLSLDIETSMQGLELFSIALLLSDTRDSNVSIKKVLMVGPVVGDTQASSSKNKPDYLSYYANEAQLMVAFIELFQTMDPDIIIGWSVINFDLRFLQRKADHLGISLSLARGGEDIIWRLSRESKNEHYTMLIPGRLVLDGIETLKSATYHFESFSLQYVANELLQRGKLIQDVENRGEAISKQFHSDKVSLAAYNLEDCQLVWDIFQEAQLIHFAIERAQLTGLAMDRFGGSVASFDNRYLPRLHRAGFVAPNLKENPENVGSPGGYVMNSKPGIYQHVLVLDFKSLYPSIIRTFKIDPMALVVGLQNSPHEKVNNQQQTCESNLMDLVPGFNGAVFSKEKNLLPMIIDELWAARDVAKRENNLALSQAIKILMNSFYGVLGTPGCRFFDSRLPSSITLRGHEILIHTQRFIESKGYRVIYGDTDSIFVCLDNLSASAGTKQINAIGQSLAEQLNIWWQDKLHRDFLLTSHLEIEFETHFKHFVMPTIRGSDRGSKKRYAGLVESYFNGESQFNLVFKGLETVRTDWTRIAREFQRELYRRIFYDEPYVDYIKATVEAIRSGNRDDDLVYRKRIRRGLSDYQKNIPPQIQAARIADSKRQEEGKPLAYQQGGWIEYVWTLEGPEPVEYISSPLDYDLYIERQIEPIADGILQFLGCQFKDIAGQQIGMF